MPVMKRTNVLTNVMRTNVLTNVLTILSGAALVAVSFSTVRAQATRSVNDGVYAADQAKRGEMLYADTCAACHDAKLSGGIGPALAGKDFIGSWKDKTVGEVFTKIKVEMPLTAPGTLSPEQTADVLSFILSANQFPAGATALAADATPLNSIRLAEPAAGGPAGRPAAGGAAAGGAGLYGDAQAKRGEMVYADNCAACHGPMLGGDIGPALAGPRFVARWKDKSLADVFDKIKTTMPASAPGSLTPEQAADVLALVLSSNHYPGGATELTADAAPQKTAPLGDPPQK
jgi:mono/diheme cytochrome c family protein